MRLLTSVIVSNRLSATYILKNPGHDEQVLQCNTGIITVLLKYADFAEHHYLNDSV